MYVHYWYVDYQERGGNSVQSSLAAVKGQILQNHIDNFAKRKNAMFTGNSSAIIDHMDEIIDVLTDDKNGKRKQIFDANLVNPGQKEFLHGQRVGQYANSMKKANMLAQQLASEIDLFTNKLNEVIAQIYHSIGGKSLEEYKNQVIADYASKTHTTPGSSNFRQSIINNFITHNGLKRLKMTSSSGTGAQATLETTLRHLVLLAEGLPEYGSGGQSLGGKYYSTSSGAHRSSTGAETLGVIAGKVQGLFSNVVGSGGEIAWAVAEENGEQKVVEKLQKLNENINASVYATVVGDTTVKNTENKAQVSKGDVSVKISGQGVNIEYGVSVKNYQFNPAANTQSVEIVGGTDFLTAAYKLLGGGTNKEYLFNLAAGLPGGNKAVGKVDATTLNNQWNELVETVVLFNFLDFLAGTATQNSNNVLYLVFNGKIVTVDEILSTVISGQTKIKSRLRNTETGKSLQRSSLVAINRNAWIGNKGKSGTYNQTTENKDTEKGAIRSKNVASQLHAVLSKTKLDVSLNMLTSMLT